MKQDALETICGAQMRMCCTENVGRQASCLILEVQSSIQTIRPEVKFHVF